MSRLASVTASLASLASLALAACFSDDPAPSEPEPPQTATVQASATANVFSPASVTIARGGTVTWTFGARPHNVTFGATAGAPASVPTTTDGQAARQFDATGTFPYDCTLHPGMTGSVIVR